MKTMEINGNVFEVIKPRKHPVSLTNSHFMRSIYECYDNPSEKKKAIYNKWHRWYLGDWRLSEFGVISYNTFSFSIGCVFNDADTGVRGFIVITPCHNRLYLAD